MKLALKPLLAPMSVLVLGLALLAMACGGGEEEAPPPPSPSPTGGASPAATPAAAGKTSLRWYGHSMFLLTSPGATNVLIDPNSDVGYEKPELPPIDVVAISHDHSDHNKVEVAGRKARVLWGVKDDKWRDIDEQVGDVHIRAIATYHDNSQGSDRGKNSMLLFETGGLRILFAGDLGHLLTDEQVAAVGRVDVLLLPVGGHFTIGPAQATSVVEQLNPRLVIPMHYKTEVVHFSDSDKMEGVEPFLEGKTVTRPGSNTLALDQAELPATTTVVVMEFR